mmetsp:Transcript_16573/g.47211  ORF Transcript_16573/g.47211 Transcript_16573/m.47211 type:complete len:206 (-) Transcript_16573:311-928(-)
MQGMGSLMVRGVTDVLGVGGGGVWVMRAAVRDAFMLLASTFVIRNGKDSTTCSWPSAAVWTHWKPTLVSLMLESKKSDICPSGSRVGGEMGGTSAVRMAWAFTTVSRAHTSRAMSVSCSWLNADRSAPPTACSSASPSILFTSGSSLRVGARPGMAEGPRSSCGSITIFLVQAESPGGQPGGRKRTQGMGLPLAEWRPWGCVGAS